VNEEGAKDPASYVGLFKLDAENLLESAAADCDDLKSGSPSLNAIILRFPVDVYSSEDADVGFSSGTIASMVHNAIRGMPLPVAGVETYLNLIHVDDAIQSIAAAASFLERGKRERKTTKKKKRNRREREKEKDKTRRKKKGLEKEKILKEKQKR